MGKRAEERKIILGKQDIDKILKRLAHEILEKGKEGEDFVILGIPTRGRYLAERLKENIKKITGCEVKTGTVDATLYRDDISMTERQLLLKETDIPLPLEDKRVVLVDDVLFTGRTIRAAMDGVMDFGRPKLIQLAVLIDRGHRELPIKADFVGKNIPTSLNEDVQVLLEECDGIDQVTIIRSNPC